MTGTRPAAGMFRYAGMCEHRLIGCAETAAGTPQTIVFGGPAKRFFDDVISARGNQFEIGDHVIGLLFRQFHLRSRHMRIGQPGLGPALLPLILFRELGER